MATKTLLQLVREAEPRFWPKVDKRGPDECWPWRAGATFMLSRRAKPRNCKPSRFAWVLANEEDPGARGVFSVCGSFQCCNPRHLTADQDALFDQLFDANIDASNGSESCHEWKGSRFGDGYGRMKRNGRSMLAHRVVFVRHFGPIPPGMFVCHHCDNPPCCNPRHLFIGTPGDNVRDMNRKGRARTFRGEDHPQAKVSESQALRILSLRGKLSQAEIGRRFGLSQSAVCLIHSGKNWKHLGFGG